MIDEDLRVNSDGSQSDETPPSHKERMLSRYTEHIKSLPDCDLEDFWLSAHGLSG
jgi:hypothetical protein